MGLLLVAALSGCHGGGASETDALGSPGKYTFATSVDGGVPLNGLSAAQAAQLCADVNAANADNLQQLYCNALNQAFAVDGVRTYLEGNPAPSSAVLQAKCATYLMNQQSTNPCRPATTCDAATIATSSAYCTATVADVVGCINDNTTITLDLLTTAPSCSTVTTASLNRFFVDGGAFEMYSVVSSSASCLSLLPCLGITTISGP